MSEETVESRLYSLIADELGVPLSIVVPTASLAIDLDADSLQLLELAQLVEAEFDVRIEDAEMDKIRTVEELCELVEGKVGVEKA